jgi:hypothetical protein
MAEGDEHMRRKTMQCILMHLGPEALLTVGMGSWGVAGAHPQALDLDLDAMGNSSIQRRG